MRRHRGAWPGIGLALAVMAGGVLLLPAGERDVTVTAQPAATETRTPFTATIEAAIRTATALRAATSGTLAAATMTAEARPTVTPTATLPPPFSTVDPCVCLTPPPGPTECADIIATLHAGYRSAFATQTALARGTDTATPLPTATASETATATPSAMPPPTFTARPTPTVEPTPTTRPAPPPIWLPFAFLRRVRR